MSKTKQKLLPDIILQARLNTNDPDFGRIIEIVEKYPNRNQAVLDALRLLANLAPRYLPRIANEDKPAAPAPIETSPAILGQFDILNERLDMVIQRLAHMQSMGFSPQVINAAMDTEGAEIDPALKDEIRAQFLANNT